MIWALGYAAAKPTGGISVPYEMVWSDEFDTDGRPNSDNWDYERGFTRNEELQWYQSDNARCENGLLIIESRQERVENLRFRRDSPDWRRSRQIAEYTSSSIHTRNHRKWLYGRFEMRARIDVRSGLWQAFWTLGTARQWPGCGEIDVMEYYDGKLLANAAWLGKSRGGAAWDSSQRTLESFGDNWARDFHLWQMDWNEAQIKLYVDDQLLNTISVSVAANGDREQSHPFREPHYILLNLAIGGTKGGDPSATEFPAKFEVDYVRVYQRPKSGNEPIHLK